MATAVATSVRICEPTTTMNQQLNEETETTTAPTTAPSVITDTLESSSDGKEKPIPTRLAKAFDALCTMEASETVSSPTAVEDFASVANANADTTDDGTTKKAPLEAALESNTEESSTFELHPTLKLELSDALVNRVSFYGIIHDINKEALAMAQNDNLTLCPSQVGEACHALVLAAAAGEEGTERNVTDGETSGSGQSVSSSSSSSCLALIDEEEWLLATIQDRQMDEEIKQCPATFLQAMGELEYDTAISKSRTQLWKPSRSWWEAKSGKNPWIEPSLHNKRWR